MTDACPSIMLVDDRQDVLDLHVDILAQDNYHLKPVTSPQDALRLVQEQFFDLLILDDRMPEMSGRELLKKCRAQDPDIGAIFVSAYSDAETLTEIIRLGAADYVVKSSPDFSTRFPIVVQQALETTRRMRQLRWFRQRLTGEASDMNMIGDSQPMQDLRTRIRKIASVDEDVLVTGETGAGKELVARAIHAHGPCPNGPFLECNLGGLESTLIKSELFGAVKGAFTGADVARIGYFEAADGGTLFLDEIGELPLEDQPVLLRVLEARHVQPVGTTQARPVKSRVVAATNRDLAKEVSEGRFRADLFHRLSRFKLSVPPVRDRGADIELLAQDFLDEAARRYGRKRPILADATLKELRGHSWPGNVRELRNTVERAFLFSEDEDQLLPDSIEFETATSLPFAWDQLASLPYHGAKRLFEYQYCALLFERALGNKTRAARLAGIDRSSLYDLMRRARFDLDNSPE